MAKNEVNQIGLAEPLIASVDNGGTNTRVMLMSGQSEVAAVEYSTPHDYEQAISDIARTALILSGGSRIQAVGFAIAGEVQSGVIIGAGELNRYNWVDRAVQDDVATAFDLGLDAVAVLNDCVAAAKAQQSVNRRKNQEDSGYVIAISTGVGGAGFLAGNLIPDEPGHQFLRLGAVCGCGKIGCVEAHISGTGIERKFGHTAKNLPAEYWPTVVDDAIKTSTDLINRLEGNFFRPEAIHFFGSVALKSRYLLPGIKEGIASADNRGRLPYLPRITVAYYEDRGGLVGAHLAAAELLHE